VTRRKPSGQETTGTFAAAAATSSNSIMWVPLPVCRVAPSTQRQRLPPSVSASLALLPELLLLFLPR
jgi:hypothetical protein